MSSKRRSLPRKKPGRSAHDDIDDELPVLEPVADDLPELPLLEADDDEDDGPVKITCDASDDAAFDKVLQIEVPAMEKAAVQAAVTPALERAARRHGAELRRQRVLVRFAGEALIGSAMKAVVTETLQPHKPGRLVVRRGFGDETLHEAPVPTLGFEVTEDGENLAVAVAPGECEQDDLPVLLPARLGELAGRAKDRRVTFTFGGAVRADAAVRELLATKLRAAGARRIAVGARVLFDRDMLDAVQVRAADDGVVLTVTPLAEPALTEEALAMFAEERAADLDDKHVRIWFAKPGQATEIGACVAMCRDAGATRISLGEDGNADVVWPFLIRCEPGREVMLHLEPAGRSRSALLAAFARELGEHRDQTRGKHVVIDWPPGFAIDAEIEGGALANAAKVLEARRICCTVAGDQREPFVPPPFAVATDGGVQTVRVDVDAGKPPELLRAFDRCLPKIQGAWRGQSVRIEVVGETAPSRSLLRTLCGAVEAAGAMRLEVLDHGNVDVLLPPMLTITRVDDASRRVAALAGERTEAQQEAALARELDGADLAAVKTVRVVPSPLDDKLVAALVAKGVETVVLDGSQPVRVHPALFAAPEVKGHTPKSKTVLLRAAPSGDAAADARQAERELPALLDACRERTVTVVWSGELPEAVVASFVAGGVGTLLHDAGDGVATQLHPPIEAIPVEPEAEVSPAAPAAAPSPAPAAAPRPAVSPAASAAPGGLVTVIGRRDEAVPPLAILGVAAGDDPAHAAAVEAALQPMLPAFRGRAILLVLKNGDADVPVRSDSEFAVMLRRVVSGASAATLVFRGPDAQGRPHFQVVHSTLRAMPIGGAFGDPRPNR
ncbi:MAG: hypothetical protein H6838_13825 [Planctomycetes bacterium]|nr:hypothetical protein [Planctomycetota bacterium]